MQGMEKWMDCGLGGMDSYTEAWATVQVNGQKGTHRNGCAGGQSGRTDGWMDTGRRGGMDGQMDRYGWLTAQMYGWTHGPMGGRWGQASG